MYGGTEALRICCSESLIERFDDRLDRYRLVSFRIDHTSWPWSLGFVHSQDGKEDGQIVAKLVEATRVVLSVGR